VKVFGTIFNIALNTSSFFLITDTAGHLEPIEIYACFRIEIIFSFVVSKPKARHPVDTIYMNPFINFKVMAVGL
jgi:hypothetical protein